MSRNSPVRPPPPAWSPRTSTLSPSVTASSRTARNNTAMIRSTWGVGWRTPALMSASYILALSIAITHLLVFRYIDGKHADGPHRVASQNWITTMSNILANAFGYAFRSALAVAFVQYLWHLLRMSSMKVSTIEDLFLVRANPFILMKPAAIWASPLLCVFALVMWVSQVVTSFPPGAITIKTSQNVSYETARVPTFNASFMGNGSGVDANAYSLLTLTPDDGIGFVSGTVDQGKDANLLTRLARQVLIAGDAFAMPSPCGANCSYTMDFEGPWIECNNTQFTQLYDDASNNFTIYSGVWTSPPGAALVQSTYNGTYSIANWNSSTLTPLAANGTDIDGPLNSSVLIQQDDLLCLPGRAKFTVNHMWENNVYNRTVSAEPIDRLINLALQTHDGVVPVPGFTAPNNELGTTPANWTSFTLSYYRDNNMMAIFGAMMSWLEGEFQAYLDTGRSLSIVGGGSPAPKYNLAWDEAVSTSFSGVASSGGAQDGTVIDSTRFNAAFGQYSAFDPAHPSFNITQDTLNDYLFNMTTSMMIAYGNWETDVNATRMTTINVYSFSQPLSLILPYFISLVVAIPFMAVGTLALVKNGVSAIDGSFMQIITTSTGSATLDRAAAGGCLGGSESIPQELKDLEIRFGEIIGSNGPGNVKRTGFGVQNEITTIRKGAKYGVAKWI